MSASFLMSTQPSTPLLGASSARCSTFLDLPVVIIQEIASHLPLSAYVALSLTSRGLFITLGTLRWPEFYPNPDARLELLKLLEKDIKGLWLCPHCCILHSESMWHTLKWESHSKCSGHYWYLAYEACIYWAHIHLIGKRYIHGESCGLDVGTLSMTQKYTADPMRKGVTGFSFRAKVVDGEVLLKCIYMATVTIGHAGYCIWICPHLYTKSKHYSQHTDPSLEAVLQCRLSHLGSEQKCCAVCAPRVRSCAFCETDYDFTAIATSEGPRLFLEVWRNFGSGRIPMISSGCLRPGFRIVSSRSNQAQFERGTRAQLPPSSRMRG